MSETKNIEFDATVCKVQTLVDQGLRVTLDLPETAIAQAAQLMELRRLGCALVISVSVKQVVSGYGKVPEGRDRKSKRTPPEVKGVD